MCENMNHFGRVRLRNCGSWQSCGISLTCYHPLKRCCWPSKYTPTWQRQSPPPAGDSAPSHNANYPRNVTKLKTSTSPPNPPTDPNLIEVPWDVLEHVRSIEAPPVIGLGSVRPVEIWTKDLWRCCVVSCRVGHLGVGFESCGIWSRTSMDQAYSVWMCVWMVTLSNRIEKCNISSFSISIYLMLARPLGTRWDSVLGKAGQRHGHLLHSSSRSWAVCEERQGTLSCWAWNMINVIHFIC